MNVLGLDPIHTYLSPRDLYHLKITCRFLRGIFNETYLRYIIKQRSPIHLETTRLEVLEYAIHIQEKNVILCRKDDFFFWMIYFDLFKGTRFENWYDRYLSWFFNYRLPYNFFLYESGIGNNILYYEIIFHRDLDDTECLSIGFSTLPMFWCLIELSFMNGWLKDTIALHSDDGFLFHGGHKTVFIDYITTSTTIGCGNDMENGFLFFSVNGKVKYKWFYARQDTLYYPCIVGDVDEQTIDINYGQKPFMYWPLS